MLYTGITLDLEKRLKAHSSGQGAKFTRAHLPVKLVYKEKAKDRSSALKREAEIKKWPKKKKDLLIASSSNNLRGPRIRCFKPLMTESSQLLVLGSIPGVKSLKQAEYYAHPSNQFWRILKAYAGWEGSVESYPEKQKILSQAKIALWDVLASCDREGSLDSAIREPKFNNLKSFCKKNPKVSFIVLNGSSAYQYFLKAGGESLGIPFQRLPSTSPAHARMSLLEKTKEWQECLVKAMQNRTMR